MEYFKINYNKLAHIPEIKYFRIIILIILIFIILVIFGMNIKVQEKFECLGIYNDNVLTISLNENLSDKFNHSEYIVFNGKYTLFQVKEYGEYEVINDEIYQKINLIIDNAYDNEIGTVKFYYGKCSVLKYLLNLFR